MACCRSGGHSGKVESPLQIRKEVCPREFKLEAVRLIRERGVTIAQRPAT